MRMPADMPRHRLTSRRLKLGVLGAVVVLVVLALSLRSLARFWTDYLWFESVHLTSVFTGVLVTRVLLAVVFCAGFFVMMMASLAVAEHFAPVKFDGEPVDELVLRYREAVLPHRRVVEVLASLVFALAAGIGTNGEWKNWLLFRFHQSFGIKDPLYHKDIGFYVFQLPFIEFVLGWIFEALVVVLMVTLVAQYLVGGIRFQGRGPRVTPAVKAHVSVIFALLALVKGIDYYFERLALVLSTGHVVDGATATVVHVEVPAYLVLMVIAGIAAALFLYNIRQRGWILPAVGVALWVLVYLLVGVAYPAIYQAVRVSPSELTREARYIERNIAATRAAYAIGNVKVASSYSYSPTVTASQIQGSNAQAAANQQTISNVQLLSPSIGDLTNTFDNYQGLRQYYSFNELAADRYVLPGPNGSRQLTATITSVRELNSKIPSGFVNQHLEYTHGYGAVVAPMGQPGINSDGSPNFTLSNLPPSGLPSLSPRGSEVYYGVGSDTRGYVVADSKTPELDYENSVTGAQVTNHYQGSGGVPAGGLLRRLAFALRFGDPNLVLSGQIDSSSRVMFVRNVISRVKMAAPFLRYDSNPYPVIVDGQIYWVIDAYTTTDNYPYSQTYEGPLPSGSGLQGAFNYIRNPVKVVVNAYNGSMHFFVMPTADPIIRAYEQAFPHLFTPVSKADSIIPGITNHFRYPIDLFEVQANMYGRYHLTNASEFYSQAQAWAVSPDPGSGPLQNTSVASVLSGTNGSPQPSVTRMQPQYLLDHPPGSEQQDFMLVVPFVPYSQSGQRQNLTAFMTASSNWQDYGEIEVYETPPGETVPGPDLVASAIRSNASISQELTLLDQHGSQVELGEVTLVPLDQSILYVQPIYVESTANPIPTLKDVVVVYNGTAYQSGNASIDNALCQITNPDGNQPFANYCNTTAAGYPSSLPGATQPASQSPSSPSTTTPGSVKAPPSTSVSSLLSKAEAEFAAAKQALAAGNLGAYQQDVDQAQQYVDQAEKLASGKSSSTGGSASGTAGKS